MVRSCDAPVVRCGSAEMLGAPLGAKIRRPGIVGIRGSHDAETPQLSDALVETKLHSKDEKLHSLSRRQGIVRD